MGVFEMEKFAKGTFGVAETLAGRPFLVCAMLPAFFEAFSAHQSIFISSEDRAAARTPSPGFARVFATFANVYFRSHCMPRASSFSSLEGV